MKEKEPTHFASLFTLKLNNPQIEEKFTKMRDEKLLKYNPFVTLATFLISLINSIYQLSFKELIFAKGPIWVYTVMYVGHAITIVTFFCLILSFFIKKPLFHRLLNFTNYLLITIPLFEIRELLVRLGQADYNIYCLILVTEFFIRKIWSISTMLVFHEAFVLNLISIIGIIIFFPLVAQVYTISYFQIPYNSLLVFITFIYYFYTKEVKKAFNINYYMEQKTKWFSNVMENMTSGFIYLKNGKINYINAGLIEICKKNKNILNILEENNSNLHLQEQNSLLNNKFDQKNKYSYIKDLINLPGNSEKIMDILLSNLKLDIEEFKGDLKTYKQKIKNNKIGKVDKNDFSSNWLFEELKERYYSNLNIENNFECAEDRLNFMPIGYKDLEIEITENSITRTKIINFEVHARFYSIMDSEVSDNIEFCFKDVTRTKVIEEKNAEFKLKSLVLSKVAHEFKNPLICITELIDQIYDNLSESKMNESKICDSSSYSETIKNGTHENLLLIKSLSNYLLILVKDLDFFSQNELGKKSAPELCDTDLIEVLEFSKQISQGLLKKSNKENDISYILDKNLDVPINIYSDETKLKQILINLQSNAIKFTNKGFIKLSVIKDEEKLDFLKFEVSDTGPGMRDEIKANLFMPFKKSHEIGNKAGAGLGLSICLDLVKQLGGELQFKSQLGEGTQFSFTIPYKKTFYEKTTNPENNPDSHVRRSSSNSTIFNNSRKSVFKSSSHLSITGKSKETVIIDHMFLCSPDFNDFNNFEDSNTNKNNSLINLERTTLKTGNIQRKQSLFNATKNSDKLTPDFKACNNIRRKKGLFNTTKNSGNLTLDIENKKLVRNYNSSSIVANYYISNNIVIQNGDNNLINKKMKTVNESEEEEIKKYIENNEQIVNISGDKNDLEVTYILIVADDEPLARKSTMRNIRKAADKLYKKIKILESEDGIETLNLVFKSFQAGDTISGIITDENMKLLKGSNFVNVFINLLESKIEIPIFLVSGYEDTSLINNKELFDDIFTKPLNLNSAEKIINFI